VTKPETISKLIKHCSNEPKAYAEGMLPFFSLSQYIYGFLAIVTAYLAKGDLNA
jgi:hypothetical protein